MTFTKYSKKGGGALVYLEKTKSIQNEENIEDIYKYAIAASLLDYAKKQMKEIYFGGYLCLFAELESIMKDTDSKETTPIGMLFINIKDIPDSDIYIVKSDPFKNTGLLKKLKDMIVIDDTDYINGSDFEYTCIGESKPYIFCRLNNDHFNRIREIQGLSRYEKKKGPKGKNDMSNIDNSYYENLEESLFTILSRDSFINEYLTK